MAQLYLNALKGLVLISRFDFSQHNKIYRLANLLFGLISICISQKIKSSLINRTTPFETSRTKSTRICHRQKWLWSHIAEGDLGNNYNRLNISNLSLLQSKNKKIVTVVFIPSKLGFVWPKSFIMHGCKKFLVSSIQSAIMEASYTADNNN